MTSPPSVEPLLTPPEPPQHERLSFVERTGINPMMFGFAALAVVFFLYQIVGGTITFLLTGGVVTEANVSLSRIITMGGQLLFILVPAFLAARLLSADVRTVFPTRSPGFLEVVSALLALFALQRLTDVYLTFQSMIPLPAPLENVLKLMDKMFSATIAILVTAHSIPELLFVLLVVAAVPAFVEEMLFRGVIQRSFEKVMSRGVAAVMAGTIFGLYHLNPVELVPLIALGVFFGILRYRSQSLIIAMTAHFVNNALAVMAYYFGMEDPSASKIADAHATPFSLLIQVVLFGTMFLVFMRGYWRTTDHVLPPAGDLSA